MLVVSPNLGLDRVLRLPELRPGEVLRFTESAVSAGGKGVNVARVARTLGAPALLVGFAAGHCGRALAGLLADEGLPFVPVPAPGESRSMAIITEDSGRVTVLNEPGPAITSDEWAALEGAVDAALIEAPTEGPAHRVLVCIGSVPPGAPVDAYARLVRLAHEHGLLAIVDASGPLLHEALAAGPDVVTPNVYEALGLAAQPVEVEDATARAALRQLGRHAALATLERGARAAAVTAGSAGAALAVRSATGAVDGTAQREPAVQWVCAPAVQVVNPIGAGDAFVAGLAASLERGDPLVEAMRHGTAAAAASVETALPGRLDARRAGALLPQVQVRPLGD